MVESENVKNWSVALKMIIYQMKIKVVWGVQKVDVNGVKLWVTILMLMMDFPVDKLMFNQNC